jgi:hypothetical protein
MGIEWGVAVLADPGVLARYLDVLVEDCGQYEEALAYIDGLPSAQAAEALQKYGKMLVNHKPEQTTALLMRLCTPSHDGTAHGRWYPLFLLPALPTSSLIKNVNERSVPLLQSPKASRPLHIFTRTGRWR